MFFSNRQKVIANYVIQVDWKAKHYLVSVFKFPRGPNANHTLSENKTHEPADNIKLHQLLASSCASLFVCLLVFMLYVCGGVCWGCMFVF